MKKMNNDFDFIKDKFDQSGVNAPEQINEQLVMDRIAYVQPLAEVKKPHTIRNAGIAAAAIAVVTAAGVAVSGIISNVSKPSPVVVGGTAFKTPLVRFSDYKQLEESLDKAAKFSKFYSGSYYYNDIYTTDAIAEEYAADSYSTGTSGSSAGGTTGGNSLNNSDSGLGASPGAGSYHNSTYEQVVGVSEADTVKTDGRFIYALSSDKNTIYVYSADKENSKIVAQTGTDDKFISTCDFFIRDNKLIVLSNKTVDPKEYTATSDSAEDSDGDAVYKPYTQVTEIAEYDTSNAGSGELKLIDSFMQAGSYCSSRMIDGMLYVVSNSLPTGSKYVPFTCNGASGDEAVLSRIPADCLYSVENPTDSNILVVSSIDTDKSAQATITKAILGSADTIYCNRDNLYVTALDYSDEYYNTIIDYETRYDSQTDEALDGIESFWSESSSATGFFENDEDEDEEENPKDKLFYDDIYSSFSAPEKTQIIKISLSDEIEFVASNSVVGMINNQYSLDEYQGKLRVATTSENFLTWEDTNNFFVLDESLNQIGEIKGFATGESIKAVRYIDETAYVITYEQTDPLFVIDVSNPSAPAITGEVKISGFSTMLVPIDGNTLLGIGYHTTDGDDLIGMEIQDGLKIVTFDVSDKANPKVIDTKVFENYSSQVQYNPKALLVNFERGDFAVPMNYWRMDYSAAYDAEAEEYDRIDPEVRNGVLNFRIDDGKINVIDNYTSDRFTGEYDTIDRCVYVDDYIYMLGTVENGKTYGESTPQIDCVQYK